MTKIFGILNITPDSFSDGGKFFNTKSALLQLEKLSFSDYIDIGAQSTTYNAIILEPDQEWERLKPILKVIKNKEKISIDTFNLSTMQKAYALGYRIFNDVKGGQNKEILKFVGQYKDIIYIAMYSLIIPADKNIRIKDIEEIYNWIKKLINSCAAYNIDLNQIIIDPGIGFITNVEQSFEIIKNISEFKKFGLRTLVGHSRKSFLEDISSVNPTERDLETIIASIYMYGKVDFIRVHNVDMHQRAFKVWEKLICGDHLST